MSTSHPLTELTASFKQKKKKKKKKIQVRITAVEQSICRASSFPPQQNVKPSKAD